MMIMIAVGLLLGTGHTAFFYAAMMPGFFMALLAQKFVFVNAELRSEILTGLLLIGCALMMSLFRDGGAAARTVPVLTGLGVGLTGSRFLLFSLSSATTASAALRRPRSSFHGRAGCPSVWLRDIFSAMMPAACVSARRLPS